jgi:hypothetical protein
VNLTLGSDRDGSSIDRFSDKAVIPGKVIECPLTPVADLRALVRATSQTEQMVVIACLP